MDARIVEDNTRLAASLLQGLGEEDFAVQATGRARAALERLQNEQVEVVVLDLGLPDMDGLDVITTLRQSGNNAPILVLTAREEVLSRGEILSEAFGYEFVPGTNLLDVRVAHLRRKLEGAPVALLATTAVFSGLWWTGTELIITSMMGLTMSVGIWRSRSDRARQCSPRSSSRSSPAWY